MRPYLYLGDAIRAIQHILDHGLFKNLYNVVSGNHTPREILSHLLRHRPDLRVETTISHIMNQLSYGVDAGKLIQTGWKPKGTLAQGIAETMDMLGGLRG